MDAYRDQYAKIFKGGKGVTLLAVSTDSASELASWAKDRNYPFAFLSDSGGVLGRQYGAFATKYGMDNRTVFVIAPDGTISYAAPFREIDPTAYTELADAVSRAPRARKEPHE
jgi:peroxiredoxin Q/BCP